MVIQSAVFFVLGALCAGLLALLVAPMLLRRARRLAKAEIESALPLSLNELQSEKDRLRADLAVQMRKLEVDAKAARAQATEQTILLDRGKEEIRQLNAVVKSHGVRIAALEVELADTRARLGEREEQAGKLSEQLSTQTETLRQRDAEIVELGRQHDAATSPAVETVPAATTGDTIEATPGSVATPTASDDQTEPLRRALAEKDEALERRAREAERLREETNRQRAERDQLNEELVTARTERVALEVELAELQTRLSRLFPRSSANADPAVALAAMAADREKLEKRLEAASAETERLREQAGANDLRDDILRIGAEVTALVASLEGPDGPIDRLVGKEGEAGGTSLADRIRTLRAQTASAAPEK
ncbi:MAG: hypothetical protein INR68_05675 [Methylobacterium mesophilicum]|nr:hypothetical protein [Methylobacterium mesophilicum]